MAPSTPRKLVKSPPPSVARRTRSMSRVQSPPPAPPSSFVRRLASSAGLRLSSLSAALPSLSAPSSSSAPAAPVAGPSSTPAKRKTPSKEASSSRKPSILRSPKKRHRQHSSPISVSSSSSSALSSPTPARKRVRVEAPSSSPVPRPGTVRTSASLLALLAAQPGRWELAPKGEECDRCRDEQSRHPDFPCVRPCGTNRGTRCASCTSGVCSFLPPSPAKQRKPSTTSRPSPVARPSPPPAGRSVFTTASPSPSDELPGLPPPLPPSVSFRAARPGAPLWELSPSPPPRGPRPPRVPPVVDLRSPSPVVPGAFIVPPLPSPPRPSPAPSSSSSSSSEEVPPPSQEEIIADLRKLVEVLTMDNLKTEKRLAAMTMVALRAADMMDVQGVIIRRFLNQIRLLTRNLSKKSSHIGSATHSLLLEWNETLLRTGRHAIFGHKLWGEINDTIGRKERDLTGVAVAGPSTQGLRDEVRAASETFWDANWRMRNVIRNDPLLVVAREELTDTEGAHSWWDDSRRWSRGKGKGRMVMDDIDILVDEERNKT
ncbi:hypothetical protein M231_00761 [Tremella mesenterica]|uniref:Uncharacterized protein n=1 Tax=Tremella mesenterica TaxID=5217 RepID=A0A4Q1BV69_TREME|nr:hypothetical protein M231_00761 [Tremella mesenterica]